MNRLPPLSEMHSAVQAHDAAYDGVFFVAVRTTGVVCRPSCPSRPARVENRQFFSSVDAARSAGFRPCKRCRPADCNGRPPDWVQPLLTAIEQSPSARWRDADLKRQGFEPARVRRWFHSNFGATFQTYCRERRMGQALTDLRRGRSLDTVAATNGYESHSGFRDAFSRTFGGPPGQRRSTAPIVTTQIASPLGPLSAAATDEGVCMLEFEPRTGRTEAWLSRQFHRTVVPGHHPLLDRLRDQLALYFGRKIREFELPIVVPGTAFQKAVWSALRRIPYAETRSYADIAIQAGSPAAVRAVGQANGANPVAIVIPCHRVVNSGGKLGGYGGGLWRKQFLLDLEQS